MKKTFLAALVGAVLTAILISGAALAANFGDTSNWVIGSTIYAYVTPDGIASFANVRRTNGTTFTAADPNPTRAQLLAASFWLVDTTSNAVDLDFSNDTDLLAADIGTTWLFYISAGGTNALTITAGGSGVTPTVMQAGAGSSCEDVGDSISCTAVGLELVRCFSVCAD